MSDSARPDVHPPAPWSFPEPVRRTLGNGVPLSVFGLPGQHVASIQIVMPLAVSAEPRDLEGLATIVARTMDEGTTSHGPDEFAGLLERNGVALGASQSLLGLTMQLDVPTAAMGPALDLVRECLTEPAFPDEEVGRHVAARLSDIAHSMADPASRASLEWIGAHYDPTARASRSVAGSAESVGAITAQDAREFHAANVHSTGAQVIVAADQDADRVFADVDAALGSWTAAAAAPVVDDPATGSARDCLHLDTMRTGGDRIIFVNRPGSVQTQVHLGWRGASRHAEGGWAPYPVLSYLIGGSPGARIDKVLREEKGYTYGFGAGFRPRGATGTFMAAGSVRGDATVDAIDQLWKVLDGLSGGFTDDELRSGVDYIGMTAPGRYATADVVADQAAALVLDGLGTDFVSDYLHDLPRLTTSDLAQAWQTWASEPRTLVLVGDAEQYADAVRSLGRGDVSVI